MCGAVSALSKGHPGWSKVSWPQGLEQLKAELQAARSAAEALRAEAASAQEAAVKLAAAEAAAVRLRGELEALQPQLAAAQEVCYSDSSTCLLPLARHLQPL